MNLLSNFEFKKVFKENFVFNFSDRNRFKDLASFLNIFLLSLFFLTLLDLELRVGIFNFFIASGSGQAALTMPLMAPLSDLVGVSRQIAVLAFQLGDGLTNIVIPTSASLIGCLGAVKLGWGDWLKVIWRFQLLLMLMSVAAIVIAVLIGFK